MQRNSLGYLPRRDASVVKNELASGTPHQKSHRLFGFVKHPDEAKPRSFLTTSAQGAADAQQALKAQSGISFSKAADTGKNPSSNIMGWVRAVGSRLRLYLCFLGDGLKIPDVITKQIKQAPSFVAAPEVVFTAWLDAVEHSKMVNAPGKVKIDPKVGGEFDIWDGYLTGTTLEIDAVKYRIVQSWRDNSTDWPEDHFSKITLEFIKDKSHPHHTRLRFWHSGIPEKHAADIAQGWKDYYWTPMQKYFAKTSNL